MKILSKLFLLLFVFLSLSIFFVILSFFTSVIWWAELFSHFVLQYFIGSILFVLYGLCTKKNLILFVSICYTLYLLAVIKPLLTPNIVSTSSETEKISILFSNTHFESASMSEIASLIADKNPDIVILAETKSVQYLELVGLIPEYNGEHFIGGPDPWAHDISYFAKDDFGAMAAQTVKFDSETLSLILTSQRYPNLQILGMHPYPPIKKRTYEKQNIAFAGAALFAQNSENLILVGDLNTTNFSSEFYQLVAGGDLTDARVGRGVLGSWPESYPSIFRIPIDQVLWKGAWQACEISLTSSIGSDHVPIFVELCHTAQDSIK